MRLRMRTRKLIGMVAMLIFLFIYTLLIMVLATSQYVPQAGLAAFVFYFVCGLAWTPPIAVLIWWMQRPD